MTRALIPMLLGVCLLAVPSSTLAKAALETQPSATLYADGTVLAAAARTESIYVGGNFSLIGRPTGSWIAVGSDGTPLAGRPPLHGEVKAAISDGRGGWFVAGTIRGVGGVEHRADVVHVRANGLLDASWRVAVRGEVLALALRGRTLFLGGDFSAVAGKPRRALAAVSAERGRLLQWRPRGDPQDLEKGRRPAPAAVWTLALSLDRRTLLVGGGFDRIGGRRRSGLAGINATTARVTGWNPAVNGSVDVIAPAAGGRAVYIAGEFTRVGRTARAAIAAVDSRTGRSLRFNAHARDYVSIYDVVATAAAVYIAGDFSSIGGKSRHLLAALDPRSGTATAWEPTLSGDAVTALALDARRGLLYVGGDLREVAGQRRDQLAAIDARSGALAAWDPPALGDINVLRVDARGVVYVGGSIAFVGGVRRTGLASVRPDGSITEWNPPLDGIVRALALSPDQSRLYVGGAFATADAPSQRSLAVADVSTGALRAFGGGTNSGVWALAPTADGSTLYIGGAFVTVAGKRRTRLAALDPASGTLLSWNSGANDLVRVLLPTDDALFVGGDFASAGGSPRPRLAKLDADSGAALGWNPEPDDNVWALARRNETLYVGGEFERIGGRTRNALAAIDVESGEASSWDPNVDDVVRALRISPDGERLFAAGEFGKVGRANRGYAEFRLDTGSLSGWNPPAAFDGYAFAIVPGTSLLVIGGAGGLDVFR